MNYKFKLSRRLATLLSGAFSCLRPPMFTLLICLSVGCTAGETTSPTSVTGLWVTPDTTAIQPTITTKFTSWASMSDGTTAIVPATFSATGGTITADGAYTAGPMPGNYEVTATAQGQRARAVVTVTSDLQWVWGTGLESDLPFDTTFSHLGAVVMRSAEQVHSGGYSLKMTTPAVIYKRANALRRFPFSAKLHGADLWFYLPVGHSDLSFEVAIEGWSGAQQHLSSFQWVRDTPYAVLGWRRWVNGGWTYLPGGAGVDLSAGAWHHLLVEVDYTVGQYSRLVIDGQAFDLRGLPYDISAYTGTPSMQVSILLWTQTTQSVSAFVDDVQVGEAP
jgi:hypothetical protein